MGILTAVVQCEDCFEEFFFVLCGVRGLEQFQGKQAEANQEAEVKQSPKGKSRSGKGSPAKK